MQLETVFPASVFINSGLLSLSPADSAPCRKKTSSLTSTVQVYSTTWHDDWSKSELNSRHALGMQRLAVRKLRNVCQVQVSRFESSGLAKRILLWSPGLSAPGHRSRLSSNQHSKLQPASWPLDL